MLNEEDYIMTLAEVLKGFDPNKKIFVYDKSGLLLFEGYPKNGSRYYGRSEVIAELHNLIDIKINLDYDSKKDAQRIVEIAMTRPNNSKPNKLTLRQLLELYDNWNGMIRINDINLDKLDEIKINHMVEDYEYLDANVMAFGFYDDTLCVRLEVGEERDDNVDTRNTVTQYLSSIDIKENTPVYIYDSDSRGTNICNLLEMTKDIHYLLHMSRYRNNKIDRYIMDKKCLRLFIDTISNGEE